MTTSMRALAILVHGATLALCKTRFLCMQGAGNDSSQAHDSAEPHSGGPCSQYLMNHNGTLRLAAPTRANRRHMGVIKHAGQLYFVENSERLPLVRGKDGLTVGVYDENSGRPRRKRRRITDDDSDKENFNDNGGTHRRRREPERDDEPSIEYYTQETKGSKTVLRSGRLNVKWGSNGEDNAFTGVSRLVRTDAKGDKKETAVTQKESSGVAHKGGIYGGKSAARISSKMRFKAQDSEEKVDGSEKFSHIGRTSGNSKLLSIQNRSQSFGAAEASRTLSKCLEKAAAASVSGKRKAGSIADADSGIMSDSNMIDASQLVLRVETVDTRRKTFVLRSEDNQCLTYHEKSFILAMCTGMSYQQFRFEFASEALERYNSRRTAYNASADSAASSTYQEDYGYEENTLDGRSMSARQVQRSASALSEAGGLSAAPQPECIIPGLSVNKAEIVPKQTKAAAGSALSSLSGAHGNAKGSPDRAIDILERLQKELSMSSLSPS
ncbi:hypothetical protein PAPHI01_1846 [Pancytospora philotis]|nr:hypothetical protein PAPHI01_1846 [Pancytospora philotis]